MGKTISEKIFSEKTGRSVTAGDLVIADIDMAMGQDGTTPLAIRSFQEMNGQGVFDPKKIALVIDHNAPSPLEAVSELHDQIRHFADKYGLRIFDAGCGICHELMVSEGLVVPGDLVIGADSHTCTYGALGAFSTGVGSSELAAVMIAGKLWFKVPESIRVILEGRLPKGVYSKDVALALAAEIGADGANYQALEYSGPVVDALSVEERLTLTNMAVEMGAKAGLMAPDEKTRQWLSSRINKPCRLIAPDPDAVYAREVRLDCSRLTPRVALPHQVDTVVPIEEVGEVPIRQAFLGTCTNGRTVDFQVAASILYGRSVHPSVRLIAAPASRAVFLEAVRKGWAETIVQAGGMLVTPGCGPCVGTHQGVPGDGWNVISTANRNFKGRMGNNKAFIYLASPATVAVSAITGRITDPRGFLA
ncbi:MAG TPA: 3-isopropylmalate dehydratase large subunit [Atribacteraceae bacterium]|nr:3-isopropylmalate dehydratase large subunit [Atribacteraceae bacterium]